jgi:hypothetical protein
MYQLIYSKIVVNYIVVFTRKNVRTIAAGSEARRPAAATHRPDLIYANSTLYLKIIVDLLILHRYSFKC